MGWFKKEKKEAKQNFLLNEPPKLPELPPLPPLKTKFSDFPKIEEKVELPPLPSFPSSSIGDMISRQAVRQAIKETDEIDEKPFTCEIDEKSEEFAPYEKYFPEPSAKKPQSPKEPVFVRIDKFKEAMLNFQKIKAKILEIENLLKEIREIKSKEEFELQSWEKEIQDAKNKLNQINNSLFQKLG